MSAVTINCPWIHSSISIQQSLRNSCVVSLTFIVLTDITYSSRANEWQWSVIKCTTQYTDSIIKGIMEWFSAIMHNDLGWLNVGKGCLKVRDGGCGGAGDCSIRCALDIMMCWVQGCRLHALRSLATVHDPVECGSLTARHALRWMYILFVMDELSIVIIPPQFAQSFERMPFWSIQRVFVKHLHDISDHFRAFSSEFLGKRILTALLNGTASFPMIEFAAYR